MIRSNRLPPWAAIFIGLVLAGPVRAAGEPDTGLAACSALVARDPDKALTFADDWEKRGGGGAARLCRATALFKKENFGPAGDIYEALANERGGADARAGAELLVRAGWARARAGRAADAERLYSAALEKSPDAADVRVDRSIVRAESGRWAEAIEDLDRVLAVEPDRADALLYRGAALRALRRWDAAGADAARLLKARPNDPDALLLRGNILAGRGDLDGAANDWRAVIKAAPKTPQGDAAAINLKRLETARNKSNPPPKPSVKPKH